MDLQTRLLQYELLSHKYFRQPSDLSRISCSLSTRWDEFWKASVGAKLLLRRWDEIRRARDYQCL